MHLLQKIQYFSLFSIKLFNFNVQLVGEEDLEDYGCKRVKY